MAESSKKFLGNFEIIGEISGGSGAQGRIYIARCLMPQFAGVEVGATVALKVMPLQDTDGVLFKKLEKRTGALASIRHPNIIKYYGCFAVPENFNDLHVVVMEHLHGHTLKKLLEGQPGGLDVDKALKITHDCLSGLSYAAGRGICHRDIKPANIFVCDDGSSKLIDFEIARQEGGTQTVTSQGNLRGTFDYMAPDFTDPHFRGDERSDIFSLGVCLHEAITGRTPYAKITGNLQQANFIFHTRWGSVSDTSGGNVIKISSRVKRLATHLDTVIAKALERERDKRHNSFKNFSEALQAAKPREIVKGETVYQLLQYIGKGGFGEVFKGRRLNDGRLVAIKHLLKEGYADRFLREAKILRKLKDRKDPRFVQFLDFIYVEKIGYNDAFLIMDFLTGMPGGSLRDRLRGCEQGLPADDVMAAFARFAEALHIMHGMGIIHRDIKPSNLYMPEGDSGAACIMDLGVARDNHGTMTHGRQVPGTLDYMPPEVVFGESRGDAGMDIYALGLCFYEALAGKPLLPRLPSGDAAIEAFVVRSKEKKVPVIDDPAVKNNERLCRLLARMTHPEIARRECDASRVAAEIRALSGATGDSDPPVDRDHENEAPETVATHPVPPVSSLSRKEVSPTVTHKADLDERPRDVGGGDGTVVPKGIPRVRKNEPVLADDTKIADATTKHVLATEATHFGTEAIKAQLAAKHPVVEAQGDADRKEAERRAAEERRAKQLADEKRRLEERQLAAAHRDASLKAAFRKFAAGVLWLCLLAATGYAGWHYRHQIIAGSDAAWAGVTDLASYSGFRKRMDLHEQNYEEFTGKVKGIIIPDDYLYITNQATEIMVKMEVDFTGRFAKLLSGERKTNRKAVGEYQSLKNSYAALFGQARQIMESRADTDKKSALAAYSKSLREGDEKYETWKKWIACLSQDIIRWSTEELETARKAAMKGMVDELWNAALESYRDNKLESGD
ncbi:MAG: serine/threonine-protein kinase, partial [Kiritimatiellae bacterium]|nr:serine/threonine-protein kinase [Kiritimatiellia bacterium]